MPVTVTVRVDGLRELGEKMRGLSEKMNKSIATSATGAAAKVIKTSTKRNLSGNPSIDSGLVEKNVIVKKVGKNQTTLTSEHIVTVKKVDYPLKGKETKKRNTRQVFGYLEFGTIHMKAEPSLRPAFDSNKENALQAMTDRLAKRLNEAAR